MPTYEFRCPKGHEFEKFYRSMSAAQLKVPCPMCGKTADRQVSAGAGLVFKGSGFYITDYGKDGKKSAAPAATAGAPDSSSSAGSPSSGAESGGAKGEQAAKSDSKPPTASKSAAKKSSRRAKSSE